MPISAADIATLTQGRLDGPDRSFAGVETQELAGPDHVTFAGHAFYAKKIDQSQATGAIVTDGLPVTRRPDQTIIWVANADVAVAQVLERLAPPLPLPPPGVHPTAVIDPTARLGEAVRIGEYVVIQAHAVIGDRTVLMAGTFIGAETTLGNDCLLWPRVTVRERCTLGHRVILHPGVVIGADGFGYRFHQGRHLKIPQIGTVTIGDDCELGANTAIDRGKFSATIVGAGSKLDNLVQIGHNVRLGQHCILVGHTAIGGSTVTGDYLVLGGGAVISDHIKIGTGVQLAGMSALTRHAADGQVLAGIPARDAKEAMLEARAIHHLPRLAQTVQALEERIAQLESAAKNPRP